MTTFESNPTLAQFLFWKVGKTLSKREAKQGTHATHALTVFQSIVRLVMHLGGLCFLTLAGFSVSMTAGLIVAGVSFFILSWLNTANRPSATQDQTTRR